MSAMKIKIERTACAYEPELFKTAFGFKGNKLTGVWQTVVMLSGGGNVHQFQNGFFHGKYIIIDNQVFDIGTANFDRRSLFLNYEVNCFIYDSAVIEAASKEIEQDIKQSKSIVLKDLQNLGLWVKIKEIAASTIVNFL